MIFANSKEAKIISPSLNTLTVIDRLLNKLWQVKTNLSTLWQYSFIPKVSQHNWTTHQKKISWLRRNTQLRTKTLWINTLHLPNFKSMCSSQIFFYRLEHVYIIMIQNQEKITYYPIATNLSTTEYFSQTIQIFTFKIT